MRPVEYRHRSFPWIIFIAVLIPVFVLAAWFLVKGWQLSRVGQGRESEVVANGRTSDARSLAKTPKPLAAAPRIVTNVQTNAAFVATNSATQSPLPIDPPKPVFPKLKLQGIFWRPSRPSAVINSKTLFKGDRIDNARVLAIDQESVTLQWQNETKVLTLP